MKKTLASAVALCVLATAGVAAAAELTTSGDVNFQYRWNTKAGDVDRDGSRFLFRLNATADVAKNLDFYARYAYEGLGNDRKTGGLADFDQGYYGEKNVSVVDRFGFDYKNAGYSVKLGRQGATIGGTALLYSTEGYMGINVGAIDGVSINAKSGVTSINAIAGTEWNSGADKDNQVYGLRASYSPAKDWTAGATLAQYKVDNGDTTSYYAVDAAYSLGKANFSGEYAKSSADDKNNAYDIGVAYTFNKKVSAFATYFRVEENGDMGAWTDFDNNQKGMYYGVGYQFDKKTSLNLFYKNNQALNDDADSNTSFRTTVTYKF